MSKVEQVVRDTWPHASEEEVKEITEMNPDYKFGKGACMWIPDGFLEREIRKRKL